jgi:TRAP transporter 4TM/12TM fusion protein
MPDWKAVLRTDWVTLVPLAGLLWKLFDGSTPYLAAFWGITLCIVVGLARPVIAVVREGGDAIVAALRAALIDMVDAFVMGAKYALAVGAAAAAIGVIIGVVTLTGTALKFATIIVGVANDGASALQGIVPTDRATLVLLFTLVMTALVCILMGCGVPTTATYIIMVTVAAPAMGLLGVAPLVTHFFVFYYGVLADVTPPVAVAAYAAASMAGADPFRTGNTAFRLALAKALVPFVFVFSPSLLLVLPGFSWGDFLFTLGGCMIGITFLGAAFSRYMLLPLSPWECWLLGFAALPTIAPGVTSTLIGIAMATPVLARQLFAWRAQQAQAAA